MRYAHSVVLFSEKWTAETVVYNGITNLELLEQINTVIFVLFVEPVVVALLKIIKSGPVSLVIKNKWDERFIGCGVVSCPIMISIQLGLRQLRVNKLWITVLFVHFRITRTRLGAHILIKHAVRNLIKPVNKFNERRNYGPSLLYKLLLFINVAEGQNFLGVDAG